MVISHDFAGMDEVCPRTLHLRNGAMEPASTSAAGGTGSMS
ncbi:transmembrane ATP-binding ABC transporter domain protein [Mycobacterium kansasii]|uniref:Transmembrane ATP-binding ABC transporter domain protein n=1 Tax=Mycobacterium kansasii TaxID=1768 RepID=A0A1V3X0J0_MYCKA|nr:transmembrane ATP-binding ABC transporter domain protein [Mycobacterium kansasii]